MVASKANYQLALNKIKELEEERNEALANEARANQQVEDLKTQIQIQAGETESMGKASLEVREEDSQRLADYQATNTELIEFAEKVANGRTKHRAEAQALLGIK